MEQLASRASTRCAWPSAHQHRQMTSCSLRKRIRADFIVCIQAAGDMALECSAFAKHAFDPMPRKSSSSQHQNVRVLSSHSQLNCEWHDPAACRSLGLQVCTCLGGNRSLAVSLASKSKHCLCPTTILCVCSSLGLEDSPLLLPLSAQTPSGRSSDYCALQGVQQLHQV